MEHRRLLVVCFTFTKSSSGPPWNEGHWPKVRHETSVLEVPVQEQPLHSFNLVLLICLLDVFCTEHLGVTHHWALKTSGQGWADSKAVHRMECSGVHSLSWRSCHSRGCYLKCTVPPVHEGVLTKTTKYQRTTDPRSCVLVVYIAGDTLRHQPMGAGHMTVLHLHGPMGFCVLQWCHPMLACAKRTSCCTWFITLYGT